MKTYILHGKIETNPLKDIKRKNKTGWQIGNLTIFTPERDKRLRNIICQELKIKNFVFLKPKNRFGKSKKKKKRLKHIL